MAKRKKPRKPKPHQAQAQLLRPEQVNITREARYIISRAQAGDARVVTLGPFVFFSTETKDAWMLDSEDNLALCLARGGEEQEFTIMETSSTCRIEWNASYRIDGDILVVIERSGQVTTISGNATRAIQQAIHSRRVHR